MRSPRPPGGLCAGGEPELDVLDVGDRLLEQMRDVVIVQVVENLRTA